MKTDEEKRQFILNTLLPYKEDPSTRAVIQDDDSLTGFKCVYLTEDGRKCAVGKHLKEGKWQKFESHVGRLDNLYLLKNILTEEALSYNLSIEEWKAIQNCHDSEFQREYIQNLEDTINLKFPELY